MDLPKVQIVAEVDSGSWVLGKLERLDKAEAEIVQLREQLITQTKQVEKALPGLGATCGKCEVEFSVMSKRTAVVNHCPFCGHRRWLRKG
jgi:hypothetical protein